MAYWLVLGFGGNRVTLLRYRFVEIITGIITNQNKITLKIIIIGGGNMGLTFAKAFINAHVIAPEDLMILEKDNEDKITQLNALKIAQIHTDPSIIKDADLIILSVKPQDAPVLYSQMRTFVDKQQLVLSIMAGITIQSIVDNLGVDKVIRAMPNLPSQIGVGMTAFTSTDHVSRIEEQWIQNLLQTTGKAINVSTEREIDVVTAISGSGPAYIYYFMDSMITAAKDMGLSSSVAEMLVKQTFKGALDLYKQSSLNCKEWIQKVSSKGGTTEAAINQFDNSHLDQAIINGAKAAFYRAEQLGK